MADGQTIGKRRLPLPPKRDTRIDGSCLLIRHNKKTPQRIRSPRGNEKAGLSQLPV
jgi:hypothetical protein